MRCRNGDAHADTPDTADMPSSGEAAVVVVVAAGLDSTDAVVVVRNAAADVAAAGARFSVRAAVTLAAVGMMPKHATAETAVVAVTGLERLDNDSDGSVRSTIAARVIGAGEANVIVVVALAVVGRCCFTGVAKSGDAVPALIRWASLSRFPRDTLDRTLLPRLSPPHSLPLLPMWLPSV